MGDHRAPFRVLCVDDNRDVADSTALLLNILGFDTCACYDGHTALGVCASFRPDICIVDLNMPGMAGDELAVLLRAQLRPVLLVAMTAMNDDDSRARIEEGGFNLHLVKPVHPMKLVEVVTALVRTTALSQAGG